jgi:hypothetical protein
MVSEERVSEEALRHLDEDEDRLSTTLVQDVSTTSYTAAPHSLQGRQQVGSSYGNTEEAGLLKVIHSSKHNTTASTINGTSLLNFSTSTITHNHQVESCQSAPYLAHAET